jgi:hypothetical protein
MNRIMVDKPVEVQLAALVHPVEVVDGAGRSLGHFVPARATAISDDCPYSPEELARMHNAEGGRSLGEIWKSLGAK